MALPTLTVPLICLPLAALALGPAFMLGERFDHVLAALWIGMTVIVALLAARDFPYVLEAFALAVSVWAIRMGGRQGWGGVTGLGYIAFAVTMFVIYTVAAHGLLGTSFFYLGAGALLLAGALVLPRIASRGKGTT
jgi:uncharacterized membrane protein